jgi:DNA-binding NtrC family response regulator
MRWGHLRGSFKHKQLSILARLVPTLLLVEDSHKRWKSFVHSGWPLVHQLRKPRILCIDDTASELEMRLRKSVLEIAGYELWATRNPWEAIQIIRNNDVELILTEHIVMNGGPPLTQILKRLKPHVPVVIYSGAGAGPPADIGMADRLITKLASTDELLRTIEELLAKTQTRAAA